MEIRLHPDPASFLALAGPFLERTEAENNLLLGILGGIPASPPSPPLLLTISEGQDVVSALICTPPWGPIVTEASPEVVREMVRQVAASLPNSPAVVGPRPTADLFAEEWARQTGQRIEVESVMRNFILRDLQGEPGRGPTGTPVSGGLIPAHPTDEERVVGWIDSFYEDVRHDAPESSTAQARRFLASGELYFWADPEPVAMLMVGGRTPHGARVSLVYTPPALRGRVYAYAAVRELSRRLLAEGARYCFLFTDALNPTSNHIYQLIGYQHIGDFVSYRFISSATTPTS